MILKSLSLIDFGVFGGRHDIDLAPRVKYGSKRPIVLFGGLNGAGKTTTLTAVRLALYGRQSMGRSISYQAYHQQLLDYIHKPSKSLVKPNAAAVELDFTYGKHGTVNEFKIIRSWQDTGKKAVEHLEIYRDDQLLEGLSSEQLQSFLNELIPIGVADLFFFDGEKIADLAEDDGNEALADAIKRLLGLDIIDRLRADLGIYLRENTQTKLPADISKELASLEKQYQQSYAEYQSYIAKNEDLNTELVSITAEVATTQQRINDLGGAWAKSRQAEEIRAEQIIKEKDKANSEIRELFADAIPLALAKNSIAKLLSQLEAEKASKSQQAVKNELNKHLKKLRSELTKAIGNTNKDAINTAINSTFDEVMADKSDVKIIHDISDSEFERIQNLVTSYVPQQVQRKRP